LHVFSVDRSEHMINLCAKIFFFYFVYTQDEKKKSSEGFQDICFHYPGNQNMSLAFKNRFLPYFWIKMLHKSGQELFNKFL